MRWRAAALVVPAVVGCNAGSGNEVDECRTAGCTPGALVWSTQAVSFLDSAVTAVATSPGEPPWFAGSYDEQVELGGRPIGYDTLGPGDGFAARVAPRDLDPVWTRVAWATYPLHVAGIVPDGEEGAIITVVGQQEDTRWRVEALWFDRHTETFDPETPPPGRRGTIAVMAGATATPPAVMAVGGQGWPLVAISGSDIVLDGDPVAGPRAMVFRVGQGLVRELLFDAAGIEILALAATTDGAIILGGTYHGTVPDLPDCPEASCAVLVAIEAAAGAAAPVRWRRTYRAAVSAGISALAAGPDGTVAAMLRMEGASIDPPLATDAGLRLSFFDDLGAGVDDVILAPSSTVIHGAEVALTGDGHAVVALAVEGAVTLGDETFTSDASGTADVVIAELSPAGGLIWQLPLRSDGALAVGALAVESHQVAVGGSYQGNLSVPASSILGPAASTNGYVLELAR